MEEQKEQQEKCISCKAKDDLFKLQDDEGYICRECLFRQYDFTDNREFEND